MAGERAKAGDLEMRGVHRLLIGAKYAGMK
jgi:hypothetical protein